MRMRGSWHLYRHGEGWQRSPRAARIRLDTAAWVAVAFDVPVAEFVRDADLARHRPLALLGPDLADPAFDRSEALARLAAAGSRPMRRGDPRSAPRRRDRQRAARRDAVPRRRQSRSSDWIADRRELGRIVDIASGLIRTNARSAAGAIRNTTRRMAPGQALWVYQRTGQPCRALRHGDPFRRAERGRRAASTGARPASRRRRPSRAVCNRVARDLKRHHGRPGADVGRLFSAASRRS